MNPNQNHIVISQGETKTIGFLGIDEYIDPLRIIKVDPVPAGGGLPYTHLVTIAGGYQNTFAVGDQIYFEFEGKNSHFSGCYVINSLDSCGTEIGFNAEECLGAQQDTVTVTNCCGVSTTRVNSIGYAYKPLDVNGCGKISSHIRVLSSYDLMLPPLRVSTTAGSNLVITPRSNRPRLKKGAYVTILGVECLILDVVEVNRHNISVVLDQTMMESSCQTPMCYSAEPIATMLVGTKDKSCFDCGWVQMRLPQDQSMRLMPGVIYNWDIMGYFEDRVEKLGSGTLEVLPTYTFFN